MRFNENEEFDVLGFWDESISQVRINHNNQLYFFIELLSPFPKSVNAKKLYKYMLMSYFVLTLLMIWTILQILEKKI